MAKKYVVETWSKSRKTKDGEVKVKYYHSLVCNSPKTNILYTASHASRNGRSKAIKKIKQQYPGVAIQQQGRK